MVLERLYPDHIWDGIANNYTQIYIDQPNRAQYVVYDNYATFSTSSSGASSSAIIFNTPVSQTGTLHLKFTINSVTNGAYVKINTSDSTVTVTDSALFKKNVVGTYEYTGTVAAGKYIAIGTTYDTQSAQSANATITELYVD